MKKAISLFLLVVMMLSSLIVFTGCGDETSKFIGTWKADIDLAAAINESVAAEEEMAELQEYFTVDSFIVSLVFTFNKDGTYAMSVEETSVQNACATLMTSIQGSLVKVIEDQFAAAGMTLDAMLALSGMSLEEFMAEMMTEFDGVPEQLSAEIVAEFNTTGNFKVEDGKLFTFDDVMDETVYDKYTIKSGVLTLTEQVGADDDVAASIYPIEFKKQK